MNDDESTADDFAVETPPPPGALPLHFREDMETFMGLSEMTYDDLAAGEDGSDSIAGMDPATFSRLGIESDSLRHASEADAGRHFQNQQGAWAANTSLHEVQSEMLADHERRLRDMEDFLRRRRGE